MLLLYSSMLALVVMVMWHSFTFRGPFAASRPSPFHVHRLVTPSILASTMKLLVATLLGLASPSLLVEAQFADHQYLPSLRGRWAGRQPAAPAANNAPDNNDKPVPVSKSDDWWEADKDPGQHPWNIASEGNTISLTIKPDEESVKINSKDFFNDGTFTVRMKSAAAMPGTLRRCIRGE